MLKLLHNTSINNKQMRIFHMKIKFIPIDPVLARKSGFFDVKMIGEGKELECKPTSKNACDLIKKETRVGAWICSWVLGNNFLVGREGRNFRFVGGRAFNYRGKEISWCEVEHSLWGIDFYATGISAMTKEIISAVEGPKNKENQGKILQFRKL